MHVPDRLLRRPVFVDVDTELGGFPRGGQGIPHDTDAPQVGIQVEADLQLAGGDPPGRHARVERGDLLVVQAQVDAGGVGANAIRSGAESAPQRFAVDPRLQVPERRIDGGDGGRVGAAIPLLEDEVDHPVPVTEHAPGILANKQLLYHVVDEGSAAEADATEAFVRVQKQGAARHLVRTDWVVGIPDGALHGELIGDRTHAGDLHGGS